MACYAGYITQAVVNNFLPLLFVTLQAEFSLTLGQITLLVTVNFLTQLFTDLLSAKYVDRMGYRVSAVAAHTLCCALDCCPGCCPRPIWGCFSRWWSMPWAAASLKCSSAPSWRHARRKTNPRP